MSIPRPADGLALCDHLSHIACTDAHRRMFACGGMCSDWRVWITNATHGTAADIYIGPDSPGVAWRSLYDVRVGGFHTLNQMHNVVRAALRMAPIFADVFAGNGGANYDKPSMCTFDADSIPSSVRGGQ